jgi:hypothetical protein
MREYPFFYVPVDMQLLRQFSDDIELAPTMPPYESYFDFPVPESMFRMNIYLKKDFNKQYVRDVALQAGLNPKYFIHTPDSNVLYGGVVCQLKGREGYWCMATHCGECLHKFLQKASSNRFRCQCDAPNCANNIRFRRRFIHDD